MEGRFKTNERLEKDALLEISLLHMLELGLCPLSAIGLRRP